MNGITVKSGEGMLLTFENSDLLKEIKFVHTESKEVYTREINLEYNAKKSWVFLIKLQLKGWLII